MASIRRCSENFMKIPKRAFVVESFLTKAVCIPFKRVPITDFFLGISMMVKLFFRRLCLSWMCCHVHWRFSNLIIGTNHEVLCRIIALKILRKFSRKHFWRSTFLLKQYVHFSKEIPPHMFPWKFSRIFRNRYFKECL